MSNSQKLMDSTSSTKREHACVVIQATTAEKHYLPNPVQTFGKTSAEDSCFHFSFPNSTHLQSVGFKTQAFFPVLKSCWGEGQRELEKKVPQEEICVLDECVQKGDGVRRGYRACGQTELSFTNPLTESSWSESWLAGL